ncbi:MAG: iron ABC transporter [Verrucomicrobiales bacterium]|nr:iron ABC transporter [Verrucomicrobiales bacterium]
MDTEFLQRFADALLNMSYNQKVIYLGVVVLGAASGLAGTFLLFRKRSLLSDTVSHATLPGIAIAFLLLHAAGRYEKQMVPLMIGAFVSAWLSMQMVRWIRKYSRIKDDAALAVTLTAFYGLGVVLRSVIQQTPSGNSSGLESYLFGMVASMVIADAYVIIGLALVCGVLCLLCFKEFSLLCFDARFAQTQGYPTAGLDVAIMTLAVSVAVVGLQSVGLLLIMALLIIPAVTARFWTNHLGRMVLIASGIGGVSSFIGAVISSVFPRVPAGGAVILSAGCLFLFSLMFGRTCGWAIVVLRRIRLQQRLREVQFLRAVFDTLEKQQQIRLLVGYEFDRSLARTPVSISAVVAKRDWTDKTVAQAAGRLANKQHLVHVDASSIQLTKAGLERAIDCARNHRLAELYLLNYADVAPQNVHQYVEEIEEVTTPEIAADLRSLFHDELAAHEIPLEPHEVR